MSRREKIGAAFGLGVISFFWFFFLGEGVHIPASVPAAGYIEPLIFIVGIGGYFFLSEFFLSRGNPQALKKDWPIILSLNLVLSGAAIVALFIEPNKGAALQALSTAMWAVCASFIGAALAARSARHA